MAPCSLNDNFVEVEAFSNITMFQNFTFKAGLRGAAVV
jgi:hypothetical protein